MVGLLGCGCCSEPELCPNVNYLKTFSDDFSPDFEPDWDFMNGFKGEWIARDGVCSLRGNRPPTGNFSQAIGGIRAEKKTLTGSVTFSKKLIDFPVDPISTGWGELARAAIGIWSPAESTREIWFEAINIDNDFQISPGVRHPYAGYLGFNFRDIPHGSVGTSFGLGIQYFINRPPKRGDVLKLVLSDCIQDPFYANDARCQTIKAYVNNNLVFNYQPGQGAFRIRKCDFKVGKHLHQFFFLIPRSSTNPGTPYHPQMVIIKTDDFNFLSL